MDVENSLSINHTKKENSMQQQVTEYGKDDGNLSCDNIDSPRTTRKGRLSVSTSVGSGRGRRLSRSGGGCRRRNPSASSLSKVNLQKEYNSDHGGNRQRDFFAFQEDSAARLARAASRSKSPILSSRRSLNNCDSRGRRRRSSCSIQQDDSFHSLLGADSDAATATSSTAGSSVDDSCTSRPVLTVVLKQKKENTIDANSATDELLWEMQSFTSLPSLSSVPSVISMEKSFSKDESGNNVNCAAEEEQAKGNGATIMEVNEAVNTTNDANIENNNKPKPPKFGEKTLEWEKPDWAKQPVLKSSERGELVKGGSTLAREITHINAKEEIKTELGFEKPDWSKKPVLKSSPTGKFVKEGYTLAMEITHIRDHIQPRRHVKSGNRLQWETPDWVMNKNKLLQPSSKGDMVKRGANLETKITAHIVKEQQDKLGWTKPEWAKSKPLKATQRGKILQVSGDLARPITGRSL